jgi:adenine-specific DNA methylase
LARYYPTYADFEPIKKDQVAYERQPMRLVLLSENGTPDIDGLNTEFTDEYLEDKRNPRWVAKPTVAYLWARTVTCKNCRATIPLLRTVWLSKKDRNRVLLTIEPKDDRSGVQYGIRTDVPSQGGNSAQKREHDKRIGAGTTTRSGCWCPCCGKPSTTAMTKEDIQLEGKAGRLSEEMFAAVYENAVGKGYRRITAEDISAAAAAKASLQALFESEELGPVGERIDPRRPSPNSRGLAGLTKYGIQDFSGVFNDRQQLAIMTIIRTIRGLRDALDGNATLWNNAIVDFLSLLTSKLTDYTSRACTWNLTTQSIGHTFTRYAIPMTTDYAESNVIGANSGGFSGALEWTCIAINALSFTGGGATSVSLGSATATGRGQFDVILTDPPYYDSIPYSDVSDYFYIWLRRILLNRYPEAFQHTLVEREREIIQHAGRLDGDNVRAKAIYEDGMRQSFEAAHAMLADTGRFVVVFAHKDPVAWETLAGALIKSGFIVDGSWPIQTERPARTIALATAALASSVWLVCKKRPATARPGWDNNVLDEMRANIAGRLRDYWDAGIRGPDFVWAATGPALEVYSKHPVVRKANEANATMGVGEFLNHVRRMVVDYVVGQVLSGEQGGDIAAADRLDEVTAYYLLHRNDFKMDEAPVGACILYATACGLSDAELERTWNILTDVGNAAATDEDEDGREESDGDSEPEEDTGGGSTVKLKAWNQRQHKTMGYEAPEGRVVPLIDRVHRVMHLWKEGDVQKVDGYLDEHALRRNELFKRVVQALIELSTGVERSLLESISNHIGAKGAAKDRGPTLFEKAGDA